jgi:hypothetical protein
MSLEQAFTGRIENFLPSKPSFLESIFANSAYMFVLALPQPFTLPTGASVDKIPIRLETGTDLPSLDGYEISCVLVYDPETRIFYLKSGSVKALDCNISGIKMLTVPGATLAIAAYWLCLLGTYAVMAFLAQAVVYYAMFQQRFFAAALVALPFLLSLGLFFVVAFAGLIVSKLAISRIYQRCYQEIRRWTEYAPAAGRRRAAAPTSLGLILSDRTWWMILVVVATLLAIWAAISDSGITRPDDVFPTNTN